MMRLRPHAALVCIATLVTLGGCPDDSTDPDATTTVDSTGDSVMTGDTVMNGDTPADGMAPLVAVCMNADDLAHNRDALSAATSQCGVDCLNSTDPACVPTCLITASATIDPQGTTLSQDCATCYAMAVGCAAENCMPGCLTPDSPECIQCRTDNCLPAFFMCSGYEAQCEGGVDDNQDGTTDCEDPSCALDDACAGGM